MAVVTNKDKYGRELTVDEMIKRFKRKVQQEGILDDVRKHEEFIPKSVKAARKRAAHAKLVRTGKQ